MWQASKISLLALLVAEILYLTISFDTAALARVPTLWASLLGWTPQYLRLSIAVVTVTVLTSGPRLWAVIRDPQPRTPWMRPAYLAANLCAFVAFARITAIVMGPGFSAVPHQGMWAIAWFLVGGVTLVTWSLGWLPLRPGGPR